MGSSMILLQQNITKMRFQVLCLILLSSVYVNGQGLQSGIFGNVLKETSKRLPENDENTSDSPSLLLDLVKNLNDKETEKNQKGPKPDERRGSSRNKQNEENFTSNRQSDFNQREQPMPSEDSKPSSRNKEDIENTSNRPSDTNKK